MPAGTPVAVTRQDGGVVEGQLQKTDKSAVVLRVGSRQRTIARSDIQDVQVAAKGGMPTLSSEARFRDIVVPAGTPIRVKVLTTVASNRSELGDAVSGELAEAVSRDGATVLPAGSQVIGKVSTARASGKVKGLARLGVTFDVIRSGSASYPVAMAWSRTAQSTRSSDAKKIGIPAAAGAVIGGLLGGKEGAAAGGAIGGGAGAGVVLATAGREVTLPAGTVLRLTLDRDVHVRVPLDQD